MKMENNNIYSPAVNDNMMNEAELKKMNVEITELMEFIQEVYGSEAESARLQWIVGAKDFNTLKKYYQYLVQAYKIKFGYEPDLEPHINVNVADESATMYILEEKFPINRAEIEDVTKFVFETAKSKDCYYDAVMLDILSDDDERLNY
jgi:hypothetical protein